VGPGAELVRLALQKTGRFRFRVRGVSMRPFLDDGDVVSIAPVHPERIRVGDVLCFERPSDRLVLHRVVERHAARLVTRGDALAWVEPVASEHVLGKLTAVERRGRLERIVTRLVGLLRRAKGANARA
jgi:signal peptidase